MAHETTVPLGLSDGCFEIFEVFEVSRFSS